MLGLIAGCLVAMSSYVVDDYPNHFTGYKEKPGNQNADGAVGEYSLEHFRCAEPEKPVGGKQ